MKDLPSKSLSQATNIALSLVFTSILLTACGGGGSASVDANDNAAGGGGNGGNTATAPVSTTRTTAPTSTSKTNEAPIANAGTFLNITVNASAHISGSGLDNDGKIVAYQWSENGQVLANSKAFSYVPATVGEHQLILTVTDDKKATGMDTLTVIAKAAPVTTVPCISLETLKGKIKNKQDISAVNTGCITNMSNLFYSETDFNDDISAWDVSNVSDMSHMFDEATNFNQDISAWDVSNVTDMSFMFDSTDHFNQDISGWNVSNVATMHEMFEDAIAFNQDISAWNVGNVTNMSYMFYGATAFTDRDLRSWDVVNVTKHIDFMLDAGINNIEPNWETYDLTAPVISMNGADITIEQGATYVDAGATAIDNIDGVITPVVTGTVDTQTIGTYTITYTATDAAGNTSTATRQITVIAVIPQNQAPTVLNVHTNLTENSASHEITLLGSDAEGDTLSYSIVVQPTHGVVTINGNKALYTPETNYYGVDSFTYKANDGNADNADSNIATVSITISGVNKKPTANAGVNKTVQVNTPVTLTGTATDEDGTIESYHWTEDGIELATTAQFVYTPTTEGKHTLTFMVLDDKNGMATDTVEVIATAVPNVAPTANAGADASIQVNKAITLTGVGTDSDGKIVSYQWSEGSAKLATTAQFSYTPTTVGKHILTLTVEDDQGETATDTVAITATAIPNVAPTANAGADASIQVNKAITLTGVGTDSDGKIVSYQWSEGAEKLAITAQFSYTPTTVGKHILTLTVEDDKGAIGTDTVAITATAIPNVAPVAKITGENRVVELKTIKLLGSGSDADGNSLSFRWSPSTYLSDPNIAQPTLTAPALTADKEIKYTLTVTDNGIPPLSGKASVTVSFQNIPSQPQNLQAISGDKQLKLTWDTVSDATFYDACYSTNVIVTPRICNAPGEKKVLNIKNEGFITGLTADTNYHIVLIPGNTHGYGLPSVEVVQITKPDTKKLKAPPAGKIYFGANPGFKDEEEVVTQTIKHFDEIAGKPAMWSYFSNKWKESIVYPKNKIQTIVDNGKVPFIRLMPMGSIKYDLDVYNICPKINFNSFVEAKKSYKETCQTLDLKSIDRTGVVKYSLKNIATNKDIENELRKWAQDANAHYEKTKTPLLIDFAWEMNGYWFPWGGEHQKPTDYIAAYQRVIQIFRDEGVNHVTWFFHADVSKTPYESEKLDNPFRSSVFDPAKYYPGDDYIDWLGFSLYGLNDYTQAQDQWIEFKDVAEATSVFSTGKNKFEHLASISNKPIALLEFGVTDKHGSNGATKKATWYKNAFKSIKTLKDASGKKRIKAISYWNEKWDVADMTIDSSPEAQKQFQSLIKAPTFINQPIWE